MNVSVTFLLIFQVVYDCVTNFLVNERGYDPCIKDDLPKYKEFMYVNNFHYVYYLESVS